MSFSKNLSFVLLLSSLVNLSNNNLKACEPSNSENCCVASAIAADVKLAAEGRAARAAALADSVSLAQVALEILDGKPVEDFSVKQRDIAQEWSEIINELQVLASEQGCTVEKFKHNMRSSFIAAIELHASSRQILIDLVDFKPRTELEKRFFIQIQKPFKTSSSGINVNFLAGAASLDPDMLANIFRDIDRMIILICARNMEPKFDQILIKASFLQLEFFTEESFSDLVG